MLQFILSLFLNQKQLSKLFCRKGHEVYNQFNWYFECANCGATDIEGNLTLKDIRKYYPRAYIWIKE